MEVLKRNRLIYLSIFFHAILTLHWLREFKTYTTTTAATYIITLPTRLKLMKNIGPEIGDQTLSLAG